MAPLGPRQITLAPISRTLSSLLLPPPSSPQSHIPAKNKPPRHPNTSSNKKRFHPYSTSFSSKKSKFDILPSTGSTVRDFQVEIAQNGNGHEESEIAGVEGFNLPPPQPNENFSMEL
jgi:hypothetical protein